MGNKFTRKFKVGDKVVCKIDSWGRQGQACVIKNIEKYGDVSSYRIEFDTKDSIGDYHLDLNSNDIELFKHHKSTMIEDLKQEIKEKQRELSILMRKSHKYSEDTRKKISLNIKRLAKLDIWEGNETLKGNDYWLEVIDNLQEERDRRE